MLDQQDGDAAIAHSVDELGEPRRIRRVHARCWLIEHQQRRAVRQRPRNLDQPLPLVRQRADRTIPFLPEAGQLEHFIGTCFELARLAVRTRRAEEHAGPACRPLGAAGHQHILLHGQRMEHAQVLECAHEPEIGDAPWRQAARRVAIENDRSPIGTVDAGNKIDEGRFARAVRADQRVNGAARYRKAHVIDSDETAEPAGEVAHREDRIRARRRGRARQCRWRRGSRQRRLVGFRCRARPRAMAPAKKLQQAEETGRKENDHGRDAGAINQLVIGLGDTQQLWHECEHDRAEHRAPRGTDASDQHHAQELRGDIEAEHVRTDEADEVRIERAGEARERCADAEGDYLDARHVDPDRSRADLGIADGGEHASIFRALEPPHEQQGQREHGEAEIEVAGLVSEDEAADGGGWNAGNAVHALRDLAPVEEDQAHDLAEAERGEREVMPFQPQRRNAEHQAGEPGGHARRDEGRPEQRTAAAGGDQRRGVGADAEQRRVAKRDLAGIAEHDIEADREQREDQREIDEAQRIVAVDDERDAGGSDEQDHCNDQPHPPMRAGRTGHHTRSATRSPNRPCGNATRNRINTAKAMASL